MMYSYSRCSWCYKWDYHQIIDTRWNGTTIICKKCGMVTTLEDDNDVDG